MVEYITHLIAAADPFALYAFLFVGIVATGGFILIPAVYFSIGGFISLIGLYGITVAATVFSDVIWYLIGWVIKKKAWRPRFLGRHLREAEKLERFYRKHGVMTVFIAKFVYGTRVATQLLAGMYRTDFLKFVLVTVAGASIWFWFFYFLLRFTNVGLEGVAATAFRLEVVLLAVVVALVLFYFLIGKYIKRRWFSGDQES